MGSGSNFAMAAARAQMDNEELSAEDVAKKAMQIGKIYCVFYRYLRFILTFDLYGILSCKTVYISLFCFIYIASEMCIYTNDNFTVESFAVVEEDEKNNNELSKE